MIDHTKPMRLADGREVTLVRHTPGSTNVTVRISNEPAARRLFNIKTGKHIWGKYPDLQNVPEGPQVGDTLTCGGLEATIKAESSDHFYAHVSPNYVYSVAKDTMRDQSNDTWTFAPPAPETTEWVNVYADGTTGDTCHDNFETAVNSTQFGRVRIGIIERVRRNGGIVAAKVHSTTPQLRNRNVVAHNPFAE